MLMTHGENMKAADYLKTMFENRRCFVIFVLYSRTDEIVSRLHDLPKIS